MSDELINFIKEQLQTLQVQQSEIAEIVPVLKTKIQEFDRHIEEGNKWRLAIVGISLSFAISLMGGVFTYGQLTQRVAHLEHIEEKKNER